MPAPNFIPWLFDSREAWESTVRDSRYSYDMPFREFMTIYDEYRNGAPIEVVDAAIPTLPTTEPEVVEESQILDQSEIDALISQMA